MPLYIDNVVLDPSQSFHPSEIFERHPELCERSKTYRESLQKIQLHENERVLFAHQREIVTISSKVNKQNFTHVCTDDATTCHNVILMENTSKTVSLAHFDGVATEDGLKMMFKQLNDIIQISNDSVDLNSLQFHLYLFGGFIDDKLHSEELFKELLSCCVLLPYNVKLQIACCYSMNDVIINGKHSPDIYGVAVDINNNNIMIATCLQRGPDSTLRDVRMSCSDTFSPIYDYKKQLIYIDPFVFKKMSYTNELLRLDDATFLKYCSTSPHCEPDYFVVRSKGSLLFRVKWEKRIDEIFCGKRREYVCGDDNKWKLLDELQIIFDA